VLGARQRKWQRGHEPLDQTATRREWPRRIAIDGAPKATK
jgi:hypothetical protein